MGVFHIKLNLSTTLLDEVKEQQIRDVLKIVVIGVFAQVQDLRHWKGSSFFIRPGILIAESHVIPQCPKGRGSEQLPKQSIVSEREGLLGRGGEELP